LLIGLNMGMPEMRRHAQTEGVRRALDVALFVDKPSRIQATDNKPKTIEEFVGRANTGTASNTPSYAKVLAAGPLLAILISTAPVTRAVRPTGIAAGTARRVQAATQMGSAVGVEQTSQGSRPALPVLASFDGLGAGFYGPQGGTESRNPSDNSLAVGPNDIVQIVNAHFAVYTKRGERYERTGRVLYGPVPTNEIFHGFGGPCAASDDGDAVVRYDQLARRWLFVMPIFRAISPRPGPKSAASERVPESGIPATPGNTSLPGPPEAPRAHPPTALAFPFGMTVHGSYAMCYAVSVGPDPLGPYYRYAFARKNFPDYPRPAVWPDGYYVTTSSGDTVIQKQVCVADRAKMLKGEPAAEQCFVINGANFLNPADIDGRELPPPGAPNIVMAAGGTQLKGIFRSAAIYYWKVHVDWRTHSAGSDSV
jgi:hypothetical protein